MKKFMSQRKSVFDDYVIGKKKYKNMVIYRNTKPILKVLTGQKELILVMNEIQYEEFEKLEIGYEVIEG